MLTLGAALAPNEITKLLLDIAILLGLSRVLGELARKYHMPNVLGEILAGILLGPTVFGLLSPTLFDWVFPMKGPSDTALSGFVMMSATLLLFVVGLEVDLSTVWRQGKAAVLVSIAGIALPFAVGLMMALTIPEVLGWGERGATAPGAFAIFVGISMSITALPVIAKILMDLNLAKSDMGVLIISSAMLNDLVGWIGFAIVLALLPGGGMGGGATGVAVTILVTLAFLVLMITVGRWVCHKLMPYVQAHWSWPGGVLSFVFVVALLAAAFTEWLGIHSIFGAFIAGVAIGDSYHLRPRTRDTIHQFIMNIFAPVFFASIGLRIDFVEAFDWRAVALVFAVAMTGKVIGSYLGARLARMSNRESLATGFGMAAQGAVGIILGQLALEQQLISKELMVAIVIMALGTSLLSGPAMQRILQRKQQRKLINFLADRNILLDPRGHNVEQLIAELTKRGSELAGLESHEVYQAVMQRERIMHTGLPHGLAVPHARLPQLNRPVVILARHRDGVDFDCPDGQPARIIALLLTPSEQPEAQIELLSLFAQTFERERVRNRVMRAQTSTELMAILNQATSSNGGPEEEEH